MKAEEYYTKARETAKYPIKTGYAFLGLVDEIDEVISLGKKPKDINALIKELGDVTWYIANICHDLNLSFTAVMNEASEQDGLPVPLFKEDEYTTYLYTAFSRAAKTAGRAKKILRDGYSDQKVDQIKKHITYLTKCLIAAAAKHDIEIEEIFKVNIDKLFSRKKRGVISGDGDNR